MALVGAFALLHGHAHGAEIPAGASALTYAAGFIAATAMLHGIGIAIGIAAGYGSRRTGQWAVRSAGSVMALAGVGMLAGVI